jgi:hypothetical protein
MLSGGFTMSVTTTAAPTTPRLKPAAVGATGFVLAMVIIVAGNYNVPKGENGGTGPAISTAVLSAAVAAVLFGWLVPRVRKPVRATIFLGVVTVVSLAAFWSGITPVLAAATVAVANSSAEPSKGTRTMRLLAVAAGLLAVGWTLATSHLF